MCVIPGINSETPSLHGWEQISTGGSVKSRHMSCTLYARRHRGSYRAVVDIMSSAKPGQGRSYQ